MSETESIQPSEASAETGLLDSATATEENQASDGQPQESAISHLEDDGPLERPDFWPENFWKKDENEPDLEGIAKSWYDLRKKMSRGDHKAPEGGNYDTKVFGEDAADNPLVGQMVEWAKDQGLSQSAFDDLVQRLQTSGKDMISNDYIDPAEEKAKLGPKAEAIINGMANWGRGLVNKGVLSSEDFEEFKVMNGTAKGIQVMMKIRESYEGRVPVESTPQAGMPSDEELQQMVGDPRWETDPSYRSKVEKLFNQRYQ